MIVLPFNQAIFKALKSQYKIVLGIIPSAFLGVGASIPVMIDNIRDINATIFSLLALLILLFYMAGWLLNSVIARWCFRWSNKKVTDVFIRSLVPDKWFKNGAMEDYNKYITQEMGRWGDARKGGLIAFAFVVGGLRIGGTAYVTLAACLYYFGHHLDLFYLIIQALLWLVIGTFCGLFVWFFNEMEYKVFKKTL